MEDIRLGFSDLLEMAIEKQFISCDHRDACNASSILPSNAFPEIRDATPAMPEVHHFQAEMHRVWTKIKTHTMWGPPVMWTLVNRFAPVTSSLFAYHVYHSEIGVMWTNLAILGASHCICRQFFARCITGLRIVGTCWNSGSRKRGIMKKLPITFTMIVWVYIYIYIIISSIWIYIYIPLSWFYMDKIPSSTMDLKVNIHNRW